MSRSRKKHNYTLIVCCNTRKEWSKIWHKTFRRKSNQILQKIQLNYEDEDNNVFNLPFPKQGEGISNLWTSPMDGKQSFSCSSPMYYEKQVCQQLNSIANGEPYGCYITLIHGKLNHRWVKSSHDIKNENVDTITETMIKNYAKEQWRKDVNK